MAEIGRFAFGANVQKAYQNDDGKMFITAVASDDRLDEIQADEVEGAYRIAITVGVIEHIAHVYQGHQSPPAAGSAVQVSCPGRPGCLWMELCYRAEKRASFRSPGQPSGLWVVCGAPSEKTGSGPAK